MNRYSTDNLKKLIPGGADKGKIFLDLGCGARKRPGHIGVDSVKLEGVDIVCDIEKGLPFEDNSVDAVWSNFLFEHVSDTIFLFKELYRICRNGALVEFRIPYYQSVTQYKDPTHKAIIVPEMFQYFTTKKWYGSDYGINTDFRLLEVQYDYLPPFDLFAGRKLFFLWPITYPALLFARRFLWNVVHSITVKLRVVK
ncbi:MAG: class I SAM-dependent methyltransferase [Elusimicrobia bacterium]|nr:class I SAM-dependent methyltransferase [Elusimicrobiota bacterium]